MTRLLRLAFTSRVYAAGRSRYLRLRHQRHMGPVTAMTAVGLTALAHALLPLESAAWQRLRQRARPWFSHLQQTPYRFADPLRYLLQAVWVTIALLLFRLDEPAAPWSRLQGRVDIGVAAVRAALRRGLNNITARFQSAVQYQERRWRAADAGMSSDTKRGLAWVLIPVSGTVLALLITQPFELWSQFVFVVFLWLVAMAVRRLPGRFPTLILVALSMLVSGRYIWWRYTATLHWDTRQDMVFGLILLAAETYSWLVLILGYFQTAWPLNRQLAPLPADPRTWPAVDVFIPTYNEDLNVVKPTVYAALGLDWPAGKLRVHLLDDGGRDEFREFASQVGVTYRVRPDRQHAKAGNLNYSLRDSYGDLVAIFDCDHIPSRSFLQLTTGWFLQDPKLALVQTPHHFFSPDPFERNLDHFGTQPNENTLFYGLIQDGNDLWNAAFFCGSCAVLRRTALDEIGGFAVETVTEDAHTALRLHRQGWRSAYLRLPLAAGLATESLAAHIGQRIRWARGMVQIFRTDNPLFGRGLSAVQRVCYLNAMLHFLAGIPRLIYLTAPLAFLLLHAYIIYAPAIVVALYVLPHMIHASMANSRMQGAYRRSFWGEIYETVLSWYIARPTTVALLWPSKGAFNVTAKGGLVENPYFDWKMAAPYVVLALANMTGLGFGVWRLWTGPAAELGTVVLTMVWTLYNLVLLGGAIGVAAETQQVRRSHRVAAAFPAAVQVPGGHVYSGVLTDFSSGGVGIRLDTAQKLPVGEDVFVLLSRAGRQFSFPAHISSCRGDHLGIGMDLVSLQDQIDFSQCTFARADTWLSSQDRFGTDQPLRSGLDVLKLSLKGYVRMCADLPPYVITVLRWPRTLVSWLWSFIPRTPAASQRHAFVPLQEVTVRHAENY